MGPQEFQEHINRRGERKQTIIIIVRDIIPSRPSVGMQGDIIWVIRLIKAFMRTI